MKPAGFDYHAPESLDEALELLQRYSGDAKPLAGGQSLIPAMNFRLAQPAVLVDLNRIDSLAGMRAGDDGTLRLGAMTRQRSVERSPDIGQRAPLLAEAMPWVAHAPIRNRGTIGGSLAHADPAGELPAVMVALGARFRLQSVARERWVDAGDFFLGLFATAVEPDELLTEIAIPDRSLRSASAFSEVARRHGDYALAGVACQVALDEKGRCREAAVVLFGVGEGPVPVSTGELIGVAATGPHGAEAGEAVAARVRRELDPPGDIHASPAYRRHLAGVLVGRAIDRALQRAAGPPP